MALPVDRHGETVFTFKVPARDVLLASANRLLKFEFPVQRDYKVYERLIKTNVISAGLSKRTLEALPLPYLETIYQRLWQQFFDGRSSAENELITLLLLAEDIQTYDPVKLVREDIQLLGVREAGPMHSYYYQGALDQENLITFLSTHQYRTDFLVHANPDDEPGLQLAYLACRRLSHPFPWQELLASMETAELARYPRLARIREIADQLSRQIKATLPLQPDALGKVMKQSQKLLNSPPMADIAARTGIPRPAKELLIVEGETEKLMLPLFAETLGWNFNALGIEILPAGGKNNVFSLYSEHSRLLRIPICIVLDSDAADIAEELQPGLRTGDAVFQIAEGEFEDTYDLDLILSTINRSHQPYPEVTPASYRELAEASHAQGRVQALKAIWQSYGLGSFDKIEFANQYAETFRQSADKEATAPPSEIRALLETIMRIRDARG